MAAKLAHTRVTKPNRRAEVLKQLKEQRDEQRAAIARASAPFLLNAGMTAQDMATLAAARPCPTFAMTADRMAAR